MADAGSGAWADGPKARARLVAATVATGDLAVLPVAIEIEMALGWKTYWRAPGEAGLPPHLDWSQSANLAGATLLWPAPHRFDYFGIGTVGYADHAVLPVDVVPQAIGAGVDLALRAEVLVCDDVCIPHIFTLALALPAGTADPSAEARLVAQARARVPGDGARAGLALVGAAMAGSVLEVAVRADEPFEAPDLLVEGPDQVVFGKPAVILAEGGRLALLRAPASDALDPKRLPALGDAALTLTIIDGERAMEARLTPDTGPLDLPAEPVAAAPGIATPGLVAILLLAVLGGLILNLMPCVLPVLSLKLLAVVGHGGGPAGAVRRGFLATSAGILVSFLALASALATLKAGGAAVGWGLQFQYPAFILAMAAVVTLFAANLWGLFAIPLPAALGSFVARGGGETGLAAHFLSGAFATLLATPCSAPFLGTAVGFALARGAGEIYAVFAALAVGMAVPYLAVAALPALATRLPRPGRWMVGLRALLGVALAGTAVWLLWVLAAQVSPAAALVAGALLAVAVALLAVCARAGGWLRPALAGAAAVAVALALASPALVPGRADIRPLATESDTVRWQSFDEAAIPALVARGETVFVDVTADWCITCLVNKRRVLDDPAVAALLVRPGTVAMRADWTRPDPAISRFLARFGRYGIPFNVVFGPDDPSGVALPELLGRAAVLDALAAADRSATIAGR
ncbi:MAG: copper resistance protein [Alphaproteobacteria bacterium]|nr:copper resistance protein [Alphaproteobacteria bacterium]